MIYGLNCLIRTGLVQLFVILGLLLLCHASTQQPSPEGKIAVWLDTDIGGDVDDAVCLLSAIRHPQIELVGVSTVRGCIGAVDVAMWLCREILKRSGFPQILVLPGAVASFSGEGSYPDGVGSYGSLGPAPEPVSPEDDDSRLDAVADAMRAIGKPFHLVTRDITNTRSGQ